ncbi:MAG: OsmC family protein [Chloroflexi bacterium]|nr:OsmC family protein [Chloroflexota bacterium]
MATITTQYKGNMLFETAIGKHKLTIDVPDTMGGTDRGPQPPQLFVASLGSCIGAFVAQYCERNGIDTEGMTIDVTFDKVDDPTRLVNLKATVKLPKGDCGKRVEAIERVANHCPVHETISTMRGLDLEILGAGECSMKPVA